MGLGQQEAGERPVPVSTEWPRTQLALLLHTYLGFEPNFVKTRPKLIKRNLPAAEQSNVARLRSWGPLRARSGKGGESRGKLHVCTLWLQAVRGVLFTSSDMSLFVYDCTQ